jgi:hypothetical protein
MATEIPTDYVLAVNDSIIESKKGAILINPHNSPGIKRDADRYPAAIVPQFSGIVDPANTKKVYLKDAEMNTLAGCGPDPITGAFAMPGYWPIGPKYYFAFVAPTGYVHKIERVADPEAAVYRGNPAVFGNDPAVVFPGGFIENTSDTSLLTARGPMSTATIDAFLPASGARGEFTFPSPYDTEGVRLTASTDGSVIPGLYSYWMIANNHVGSNEMKILCVFDSVDGGPSIITYNKVTGTVSAPVQIFANGEFYQNHTAFQNAYFSKTDPNVIYWAQGADILSVNVSNLSTPLVDEDVTVVYSMSSVPEASFIKQITSSADDRYIAGTYQDGAFSALGCIVVDTVANSHQLFPSIGSYDEAQISPDGDWLVIKENVDAAQGEDNRIFDLTGGLAAAPATEVVLNDTAGAAGHSDLGYDGYMVNKDNYWGGGNTPGATTLRNLATPTVGTLVHRGDTWSFPSMTHVSFQHAKPIAEVPIASQYVVGGQIDTSDPGVHENEIIAAPLDGSEDCLVLAPSMSQNSGAGAGHYERVPKGVTDITGDYFFWTANRGGSARFDLFMVKIPWRGVVPSA